MTQSIPLSYWLPEKSYMTSSRMATKIYIAARFRVKPPAQTLSWVDLTSVRSQLIRRRRLCLKLSLTWGMRDGECVQWNWLCRQLHCAKDLFEYFFKEHFAICMYFEPFCVKMALMKNYTFSVQISRIGYKKSRFSCWFESVKCSVRERSPIFRFYFFIFLKPFSLKGQSHQILGYILAPGKLNKYYLQDRLWF
jgi:hypothetical protein